LQASLAGAATGAFRCQRINKLRLKWLEGNVKEETKNWLDMVEYDLTTAKQMLKTRYPEDLSKLISSYPKEITRKYLDKASEVIKCIKRDPRLKK